MDNGTRFPDGEVGVGVVEGREAAIGIDGSVRGLFDGGERDRDGGIGNREFVEDDGHAGWVGTAFAVECEGED